MILARVLWTVVVVAVVGGVSTSAAGAAGVSPKTRDLAAEVCEDMVRDSVVAAAGETLASPQAGTWNGRRFTCSYPFRDGVLRVNVDVLRNASAAKERFAAARRTTPERSALYGLGQQGFRDSNGRVVARKDNFLLTVDPRDLPVRLNGSAVSWTATRAIFDCW